MDRELQQHKFTHAVAEGQRALFRATAQHVSPGMEFEIQIVRYHASRTWKARCITTLTHYRQDGDQRHYGDCLTAQRDIEVHLEYFELLRVSPWIQISGLLAEKRSQAAAA